MRFYFIKLRHYNQITTIVAVDANESTNTTPVDEEKAFDLSDSDEMSEKSVHPVPRGIVNPNYPGFQHLAHTLQVT